MLIDPEYSFLYPGFDRLYETQPETLWEGFAPVRLARGFYVDMNYLSNELWGKRNWICYPADLPEPLHSYGVCDTALQFQERWLPILESSNRTFMVTVYPILKSDEPKEGGWRWCKWGEYIGDTPPERDYLHDEPNRTQICVYHIYEMLQKE